MASVYAKQYMPTFAEAARISKERNAEMAAGNYGRALGVAGRGWLTVPAQAISDTLAPVARAQNAVGAGIANVLGGLFGYQPPVTAPVAKEAPKVATTTKPPPAANPSGSITGAQAAAQTAKTLPLFGDQPINLRMFERLMKVAPAPAKMPGYKDVLGQLEVQDQLGQRDAALGLPAGSAEQAAMMEAIRRRNLQLLTGNEPLMALPAYQGE